MDILNSVHRIELLKKSSPLLILYLLVRRTNMPEVKVKVDKDACIGCGLCVGTYAQAFEFDDEGKARVIGTLDEASADDAIANCPASAISKE
jgi:ferredoxin